jgi:hypothetical protein
MSLNLTPEERKYANRYLDYLDMSRRWRIGRYVIAAFFLSVFIYFIWQYKGIRKESKDIMSLSLISSDPSDIEEYVKCLIKKKSQNDAERTKNAIFSYLTLFALIYVADQWNRHRHNSIIAKILREKLEEDKIIETKK